jgi:hypothetical protein
MYPRYNYNTIIKELFKKELTLGHTACRWQEHLNTGCLGSLTLCWGAIVESCLNSNSVVSYDTQNNDTNN